MKVNLNKTLKYRARNGDIRTLRPVTIEEKGRWSEEDRQRYLYRCEEQRFFYTKEGRLYYYSRVSNDDLDERIYM